MPLLLVGRSCCSLPHPPSQPLPMLHLDPTERPPRLYCEDALHASCLQRCSGDADYKK